MDQGTVNQVSPGVSSLRRTKRCRHFVVGGSRETYKTQQLKTGINIFPTVLGAEIWELLTLEALSLVLPWGWAVCSRVWASRVHFCGGCTHAGGGAGSWPGHGGSGVGEVGEMG